MLLPTTEREDPSRPQMSPTGWMLHLQARAACVGTGVAPGTAPRWQVLEDPL